MRRARLPLWQRPLCISATSVCIILLLSGSCSRLTEASKALIDTGAGRQLLQRTHPYVAPKAETQLQQQEPAQAPVQVSEATTSNTAAAADLGVVAPAPAPVTERTLLPDLPGLAFLGLPPLPALTYQERSIGADQPGGLPPMPAPAPFAGPGAPLPAQGAVGGQDPNMNRPLELNDDNTPNPLAPAYHDAATTFQAIAQDFAAPFVAAASAPAPSASQILAAFANAIPDAPAPTAQVNIRDLQGRPAASFKLPTAATVFQALEKLGRRHLLQDGAAPAPSPVAGGQPGPGFPALPEPAAQATSSGDSSADGTWYQTNEGNIPPGGAAGGSGALPQPQQLPQPQPLQSLAPLGQPGFAEAAGAPQPEAVAPGPAIAFGPIPSEVKVFTEKLVNFLGAEARKVLPSRIDVLPGVGRKLQQGPPELPAEALPAVPEIIEPFAAMAPSAMSPMAAPGGLPQPGPIFQALPEPLPLPPLPAPERPAEAMTPGMAPETAPAGLPQPGSSFQVMGHGRKLQEAVPAPAPGPASARRSAAVPMPPLPPLPATAPQPGALVGAQAPQPQPIVSQPIAVPPAAYEASQEIKSGLTNIFKAALPNLPNLLGNFV